MLKDDKFSMAVSRFQTNLTQKKDQNPLLNRLKPILKRFCKSIEANKFLPVQNVK